MRPTLLPNLRRLWRDARTLQLGTDPEQAVVLQLARPEVARALDLLDGSVTSLGVLTRAHELGLDGADVQEVVDLLRSLGLVFGVHELTPADLPETVRHRLTTEAAAIALRQRARKITGTGTITGKRAIIGTRAITVTPADVLRRRSAARILVTGDGPLIAPVCAALAAAGVGHIDPVLEGPTGAGDLLVGGLAGNDVRHPRAVAAADAIGRAAPGTNLSPVRAAEAGFVIQFGARQSAIQAALAARGVRGVRLGELPTLEVGIRLGTVVIGPLVRPHGSPCRECLELHRRDRDPAWPVLKAQLATAPTGDVEPCAHTTALAGAAYAAEEVLAYLDGTSEVRTEAAIVEIARPGEVRRRIWTPHPRCDCRRRRRAAIAG
jgi:bacteriocin biosynthesis cyclodehydratase domain-containing protein